MDTPHKEQGWEERFRERFLWLNESASFHASDAGDEDKAGILTMLFRKEVAELRSFIQQELDAAYERAATEVEGMKRDTPLEFDVGSEFSTPRIVRNNGYNTALSQAAEKLRSFKSK